MNIVFITRCFKPTNLEAIKSRLKEVFHHTSHTYRHFILVDMTRAESPAPFADFCDPNTTVVFSNEKPPADEYNTKAIDEVLATFNPPNPWDYWVYVLDDDNAINENFLILCEREPKFCEAVIFKVADHPDWGNHINFWENAVGKVDWANFVTRMDIMQRVKVFDGTHSQTADGEFINKLNNMNATILYMGEEIATYNALPKP